MSDNPFGEPDDEDRTLIRGGGGAKPASTPPPAAPFGTPPPAAPPGAAAAPVRAAALAGEAEALPRVGPGPLAAAASPLLEMLARLANAGLAGAPNPEDLHQRALRAFRQFEQDARGAGSSAEEIKAAHYVLCAAMDDVVLGTPWGAQSHWAAKSLVSTFHQETRSGERVFDVLSAMMREPGRFRGALEIGYLALSLGLQGKYRLMPRGTAELDRVREGLYQVLAQQRGNFERELSPRWRGVDAPHRGPSRSVPAWVAGVVALALLGGGWWWLGGSLGASADGLYQRLAALPPDAQPAITRSAPPRPPEPPPPPPPTAIPPPDVVPVLRQFLAPEIAERLVVVESDAQRVMVRLRNTGMFPSASASVEPRYQDILRRIGQALREEPGEVQVIGHSDSQPIRTVRFPNNTVLSESRARDAMRFLIEGNGDAARFTAEGRADAEPIDTNATAAGRENNRRVEVILLREAGR